MADFEDTVESICENYSGYMKFGKLFTVIENIFKRYDISTDDNKYKLVSETLSKIYTMAMDEKMYGVAETAQNYCESLGIPTSSINIDTAEIVKQTEAFKAKIDAKKIEIEKAKKSLKKDIVRIEYYNLGELFYENGSMQKAAEAYRIAYCFSIHTEDIVSSSIKLGIVSIYNRNYTFGLKFVKEAVFKDLESPQEPKVSHLLSTVFALLHLGAGNLREAAQCLWERPICTQEELPIFGTEKDLAFYAIISGLLTLQRKQFKEDYYSKPNFRILLENYPEMLELGSTFINFDFDKYFKLLSQFQEEFRFDFYLSKNFFFMMQKCKKKVLVTYITPYKTVDLKEMADSIGMSIEDTERAVEELIETNEIKYKINKYNKSLSAKTEDYKLESFKKAVKVGDEFIKGMESMLLKYHLRKITK